MRISKLSALFFVAFIGVSPLVCLADNHSSKDESGLVATSEYTQGAGAAPAPRQEVQADDGGADAGGGNFHGTELFDDYENQGSESISEAELLSLAEPYLAEIRKNIPALARKLENQVHAKKWFLEPKPLQQGGRCKNQSTLAVKLEVRACQSPVAVRFDKAFFESHPEIRGPLVMHELIVSLQLAKGGPSKISDEAVRELSRLLRSPNPNFAQARDFAREQGLGAYFLVSERAEYLSIERVYVKGQCFPSVANNKLGEQALDKHQKFLNKFPTPFDTEGEIYELRRQAIAELSKTKCKNPFFHRD